MFLILVGPDGAGKTTLANKLADHFGLKYIKRDKPYTQEDKDNMFKSYLEVIENEDNVIYDRYLYCEKVYGPIMRDENVVTWEQLHEIELALAKKKAIVIHCTDNTDALWERCNSRGEDYVTSHSQLDKIRRGYHMVLQHSILPVFEYYIGQSLFGE